MGRDCPRILDRLAAFVDGLLTVEERAEIEQHLGRCPPCQTSATGEYTARMVLRARALCLRSVSVSPALRQRCEELLKGTKPPGDLP